MSMKLNLNLSDKEKKKEIVKGCDDSFGVLMGVCSILSHQYDSLTVSAALGALFTATVKVMRENCPKDVTKSYLESIQAALDVAGVRAKFELKEER